MLPKAPYAECFQCPLLHSDFVPPNGLPTAKLAVVGESPGYYEVRQGRGFVGPSGAELDKALEVAGIDRNDVWVSNAVLCDPGPAEGKDKVLAEAARCCHARLVHELSEHKVQRVIATGAWAAWSLNGLRGKKLKITTIHGKWFKSDEGLDVMPTIHPAYYMRGGGNAIKDFVQDVCKAAEPIEQDNKPAPDTKYDVISNVSDALVHLHKMYIHIQWEAAQGRDTWVSLDLETEGYSPFDGGAILCLVMSYQDGYSLVLHESILDDDTVQQTLHRIWTTPGCALVGSNFKFDRLWQLEKWGFAPEFDFDTELASWTLDERAGIHGLKEVAQRELGVGDWEADLKPYIEAGKKLARKEKREFTYRDIPPSVLYKYAAIDGDMTRRLPEVLLPQMEREGTLMVFEHALIPAQNAFAEIEHHGILIDPTRRDELDAMYLAEIEAARLEGQQLVGDDTYNPNSNVQVAGVLYYDLDVVQPDLPGKKPGCVDEATLREAVGQNADADKIIANVLRVREAIKMRSTYITGLRPDKNNRIHPTVNVNGTVTGRTSCKGPNLQNLPKEGPIRSMYIAPPGYVLIEADYSQLETRLMAWYSDDPYLLYAYQNGIDLHDEVGKFLFGAEYTHDNPRYKLLRRISKIFNFGAPYSLFNAEGMAQRLHQQGVDLPIDEVAEHIRQYERLVPGLRKWIDNQLLIAQRDGYVTTIMGNKQRFGYIGQSNLKDVHKSAVNTPIQGSGGYLTVMSLVEAHRTFRGDYDSEPYQCTRFLDAHVLMTTHDSILSECPERHALEVCNITKRIMRETAARWLGDKIPFEADCTIGYNLAEMLEEEDWFVAHPSVHAIV